MTGQIIALIVVVMSFTLLVTWVFWPGNKQRLEGLGRAALDLDSSDADPKEQHKDSNR
jgi:cbb3-type cytochrome oxidase subunit 3